MNVLIIGSGGREHALAWAIKKSSLLEKLYIAPGNAGTGTLAENVPLPISNAQEVAAFCHAHQVKLVVIGPEAPLAEGLSDALRGEGIAVFGPSQKAAQVESSKGFTKRLCDTCHIPTAAYQEFTDKEKAKAYIRQQGAPIVIKADGLAAGKGVIVAMTETEALQAVEEILGGKFGSAGASVVIEEFLEGEEVSFFALVDGEHAIAFGSAQDHKRVGDGDTGPNTGGMGTYAPAPIFTSALEAQVMKAIILPAVQGLKQEGMPYQGVLFAGLMITQDGPKLIEFNARFGDPETQVLMMRLKSDLLPLLLAASTGGLQGKEVELHDHAALCVVMAANGYPEAYKKGTVIEGVEEAGRLPGVTVFHAGTEKKGDMLTANGGRVLGVTAIGKTVAEAQQQAYRAVDTISWPDGFCRRDIGWRAVGIRN